MDADFLDLIYEKAKKNQTFLTELLNAAHSDNALYNFCISLQKYGIEVTPGDFLDAGETYSCNQLKSTNGGGVNPYMYFDDPFEMLCVQLKSIEIDNHG